jgi:hypothetical protein
MYCIVLYKFEFELSGVLSSATNRYDYDALRAKTPAKTFERPPGLNQAFQCVGSILIAPLSKVPCFVERSELLYLYRLKDHCPKIFDPSYIFMAFSVSH